MSGFLGSSVMLNPHNCLDFQTGNDPKTNRSWFSIYRGTGRILTFRSHSSKVNEICDVAEAYKELMQPDFLEIQHRISLTHI